MLNLQQKYRCIFGSKNYDQFKLEDYKNLDIFPKNLNHRCRLSTGFQINLALRTEPLTSFWSHSGSQNPCIEVPDSV